MERVGSQNPNIKISENILVGYSKEEDYKTIIEDLSASSLKNRGWKIYLRPDKVKLKVNPERKRPRLR